MTGNFEISVNRVVVHSKKNDDHGFLDLASSSHQNAVRASLAEIIRTGHTEKELVRSHRKPMLQCAPASLEFLFDGRSSDVEVATLNLTNSDDGGGLGYVPPGWKGAVAYRLELGFPHMAARFKIRRAEGLLNTGKKACVSLTKVAGHVAKSSDTFRLSCMRVEPTKTLADVYWDYPLDLAPVVTMLYLRTRFSEHVSAESVKIIQQKQVRSRSKPTKALKQMVDTHASCVEIASLAIVPIEDLPPAEIPVCRRVVLLCA